jgi:hypothetical protein
MLLVGPIALPKRCSGKGFLPSQEVGRQVTANAQPPAGLAPRSPWLWPVGLFLVARLTLSGLGIALWQLGAVPTEPDPIARPYFGVEPVVHGLSGMLLGVWQRHDTIYYLRIAAGGYSSPDLTAYFPLFPLLVRLVGILVGGNYLLASLIVSNAAALLAIAVCYRLFSDELGEDAARRATTYLVFFPTAFFLLVAYTESLALLLSVFAFWSARRGRWGVAATAALVCPLVRVQGVAIALALLVEVWLQAKRSIRPSLLSGLAVAAPVLGFAAYWAWRAYEGFPPLTEVVWSYWRRVPALPWSGILLTIQRVFNRVAFPIEYLDLGLVLAFVVLGVLVLRRLPLSFAVHYWGVLVLNLSQILVLEPLVGQARYGLLLFPAFMVLGQLARKPLVNRLILYPSVALWLFLAGAFAMWGFVG